MTRFELSALASAKFRQENGRDAFGHELEAFAEKLNKELDTLETSGCAINYPSNSSNNSRGGGYC